nr:hypothetical protein [Tanacetum cinerariifolium]
MNRDAIDSRPRELVIDDPMEELGVFVPLNRLIDFSLLLKVLEFAFEVDGMVVERIKMGEQKRVATFNHIVNFIPQPTFVCKILGSVNHNQEARSFKVDQFTMNSTKPFIPINDRNLFNKDESQIAMMSPELPCDFLVVKFVDISALHMVFLETSKSSNDYRVRYWKNFDHGPCCKAIVDERSTDL